MLTMAIIAWWVVVMPSHFAWWKTFMHCFMRSHTMLRDLNADENVSNCLMPGNSTMAKATGLIFSLFNVASAREVPFAIPLTAVHAMHSSWTYHGPPLCPIIDNGLETPVLFTYWRHGLSSFRCTKNLWHLQVEYFTRLVSYKLMFLVDNWVTYHLH